jgi:hypothetical protein
MSHWILRCLCTQDPMMKRKKPSIDVVGGVNETPEQKIARLERELAKFKENDSLRIDREIR